MNTILRTEHLCKYYGSGENEVRAVEDNNISIEQGEFVAIVGKSGSGKSTLLHMLGGLDYPTSGKVYVGEKDIFALKEDALAVFRRRKMGFIFQAFNLVSSLNVWENIVLPIGLDGRKPEENFVWDIIKTLGLETKIHNLPNTLSGGQQQRVAIARALVKLPRVLLLDEPLSNLDARLRLQTREEIRRIQKKTAITTIFVTHDQDEAMSISDLIVVMKDGLVQQIGKPQEVYDNPANLFVAKFLGTPPINLFEGKVENGSLLIGEETVLTLKNVPDQPVYVGIRPEGFILSENGSFTCRLSRPEVMGRDVSIVSTHPASQNPVIRSIVDAESCEHLSGDTVRFALKPKKVFLFAKNTETRIPFETEK